MKKLKKIATIIVQIITVILFLFLLLIIYGKLQMIFTKKNYSSYFGYTVFQIASASMEPELYVDDVILVKLNADFEVNDIISFHDEDAIVTHRVIAINGESIIVQGDNNNTVDAPVKADEVIGKVVKVYPELKIWQDIFTDPKILIVMFVTLILFDLALTNKKGDNKDDSNNNSSLLGRLTGLFKPKKKKNTDIKITEIKSENDIVLEDKDELLEFTRKIDLEEIEELLNKDQNKKEEEKKKSEEIEIKDYTIRLDLKEIQKEISKKVK